MSPVRAVILFRPLIIHGCTQQVRLLIPRPEFVVTRLKSERQGRKGNGIEREEESTDNSRAVGKVL